MRGTSPPWRASAVTTNETGTEAAGEGLRPSRVSEPPTIATRTRSALCVKFRVLIVSPLRSFFNPRSLGSTCSKSSTWLSCRASPVAAQQLHDGMRPAAVVLPAHEGIRMGHCCDFRGGGNLRHHQFKNSILLLCGGLQWIHFRGKRQG